MNPRKPLRAALKVCVEALGEALRQLKCATHWNTCRGGHRAYRFNPDLCDCGIVRGIRDAERALAEAARAAGLEEK